MQQRVMVVGVGISSGRTGFFGNTLVIIKIYKLLFGSHGQLSVKTSRFSAQLFSVSQLNLRNRGTKPVNQHRTVTSPDAKTGLGGC